MKIPDYIAIGILAADRWREAIGRSIGLREAECPEVSRIAVRGEVARIVGCRDLIHSRDQRGAAPRRQPPEPHNHAHKMRRESQQFRLIRK
jgi:hypothetical protein